MPTYSYTAHDSLLQCLVHTYSRSSPSGKAASEDVPMEDNPAYGAVSVYDTVKNSKENWLQVLFFHSYCDCVTLHSILIQ